MSASVNEAGDLKVDLVRGAAPREPEQPLRAPASEALTRLIVMAEDPRDIQGLRDILNSSTAQLGVLERLEIEGYFGIAEVLERCAVGRRPDCLLVDSASIGIGHVVERLRRAGLQIPVVALVGKTDAGGVGALAQGAVDWVAWSGLNAESLRRAVRFASERSLVIELRERAERAERMAAVGQLAAGIAHEIAQPTASVLTNLSELRSRVDDLARYVEDAQTGGHDVMNEEALIDRALGRSGYELAVAELHEMLRDCMDGMRRIASLGGELRTFSYRDPNAREPADLGDLVRGVVKMLNRDLRERARIELSLADATLVSAERGALVQAVGELVEGALSCFEPGYPDAQWLRVSTFHCNHEIGLVIEDNAYTRARRSEPGRGLARQYAERFGGRLVRTQREGTNSVSLILPAYRDGGVSSIPPAPVASDDRRIRGRALIVDDEDAVLRAYDRVLRRDFEVVTAADGAEALRLALQDPRFDFVLCDLTMPNLDGVRFFEELAERLPDLAQRVVFCTGGVFSPRQESFLRRVPNQVLDKPVPPSMLLRIAGDICKRSAA